MILHTNRKEMKQLVRSLELYIPLVIALCSVKTGKAQELKFEIAKYQGNRQCAISYTFDDGLREHATVVVPRLNKLGLTATFWINGSKVNRDNVYNLDTTRVTWAELKAMQAAGHEISNHGWAHRNLAKLSVSEAEYELLKNDSAIYEHLGIWPKTFCYPGNSKNEQAIALASKNRVATRLSQFSVGSKSTDANLDKRVENLLATGEWGVTMTHGITYGYDHFLDAGILWRHLEKIAQMKDRVWIASFVQVAAYVKERDSTTLVIEKVKKGYRIVPHLYLDNNLFQEPLTLVIQGKSAKRPIVKQGGKRLDVLAIDHTLLVNFSPWQEVYIEL